MVTLCQGSPEREKARSMVGAGVDKWQTFGLVAAL
jgi:hypothetical protein